MQKPVVLIILDGWGIAPPGPGNAISLATVPNYNKYKAAYPHTHLVASGEPVGLPHGEVGNSETGHLNIGAGRVVFQDLPRIDMSIADGRFFQIAAFKQAIEHTRNNNSALHLLGLVGTGGVHSSVTHLTALLRLIAAEHIPQVWLHLVTDGRDSPPTSAQTYIQEIAQTTQSLGVGEIATICGRYYAMDRDLRWERTQKAYDLLTLGTGTRSDNFAKTIADSYQNRITDEFIEPVVLNPAGLVKDNDAVIFFNFRIDRPRQLTRAFVIPDFETMKIDKPSFDPYAEKYGLHQFTPPPGQTTTFKRQKVLQNLFFVTMTEYEKNLPVHTAFSPENVPVPLARQISEAGLKQLHLSETEKERFVTYYLNGQREAPFPNEEWIEIPSPKVATYDLKPEMSAFEVTETLIAKLKSGGFDFIAVNFANPDMVGHTGILSAGIKACEAVDVCLGNVVHTVTTMGGASVITADHGNIEEMINPATGQASTEHSANPVPMTIVTQDKEITRKSISRGVLADVAPTVLGLLGIRKPETMTGRNLLQ